ncbi:hypothetical protein ES703_91803 [subsurface metagenome]
MPNGDTEITEERSEQEVSSEKPKVRKWVAVNIKFVDGHFLTTFNQEKPRIFHNVEELLRAIEVEVNTLTVSS